MTIDMDDGWGKGRAIAILKQWPGCLHKPALTGMRKGLDPLYGASYEFENRLKRQIWINLRGAPSQVAVTVNALSASGKAYPKDGIANVVVKRLTPKGHKGKNGNPGISTSVNRNDSLQPKSNDVLDLQIPDESAFRALVRWYSGAGSDEDAGAIAPDANGGKGASVASSARGLAPALPRSESGLSLEALLRQLAANAETGRIGEFVALREERRRVAVLGCPDPVASVRHVAPDRVDAGFDIESNWNGERRCIEVKSSTTDTLDFFISENERSKLLAFGSQAWLYRVIVRGDGSGEVVEMLPNPIGQIPEECFRPVVWRVRRKPV